MTRDEFFKYHWEYYLVLEKDFLQIERYVSFDLGDNYLYNGVIKNDIKNSECYSNEFIKQYQIICSEVDVIFKSICKEIDAHNVSNCITKYKDTILNNWPEITHQKVKMNNICLQPFLNWTNEKLNWWNKYNDVKHDRVIHFIQANLKNTINALAALYILELYLIKLIAEKDHEKDVPNDISQIFEITDFDTKYKVIGKNTYTKTEGEDVNFYIDN